MIRAVTISIILTLAVYFTPLVLANHQQSVNFSSKNTNNNLNVNKNVNKNENNIDIDIENNQTQTQTVNVSGSSFVAVPKVLPATGASPLALALMFGILPFGFYLAKYKKPMILSPKTVFLKH